MKYMPLNMPMDDYRQAYPFLNDNNHNLHWGISPSDDFLTVFNNYSDMPVDDDLDDPEFYKDAYFDQFYKEDIIGFQKRQDKL